MPPENGSTLGSATQRKLQLRALLRARLPDYDDENDENNDNEHDDT